MRIIVALSGGKASAWCAGWAFRNFKTVPVVLYFNDTKWEHPDLYRFLNDLEKYFNHPIIYDSDGRNPEQVFIDERFLGNNRVPICSKILKAKRLQSFYQDGDILVFGIGIHEKRRADRLVSAYQVAAAKLKKIPTLRFPLIEENICPVDVDRFIQRVGIVEPELYRLGFSHNNCFGGCVRSGKGQWLHLLKELPKVYGDREETEKHLSIELGRRVSFLPDISLVELREYEEMQGQLFDNPDFDECIGICDSFS